MPDSKNIHSEWPRIRMVVEAGLKSSQYTSFATTDEEGSPHMAPIGSLVLNDDCSGFYCERFPQKTPQNYQASNRVCIMAVNNGMLFWVKALLTGKFDIPPGVRLWGLVGEKREATPEEIARWHRKIRLFRGTPGYKALWRDMRHIREIRFDSFEYVNCGGMETGYRLKGRGF